MLDEPEKTAELINLLKATLPFEVELAPDLIASMRTGEPPVVIIPRQTVSAVYYLGDEGGIMCLIEPTQSEKAVVVSITNLLIGRKHPFSKAVFHYQKHRIKKLRKLLGSRT